MKKTLSNFMERYNYYLDELEKEREKIPVVTSTKEKELQSILLPGERKIVNMKAEDKEKEFLLIEKKESKLSASERQIIILLNLIKTKNEKKEKNNKS